MTFTRVTIIVFCFVTAQQLLTSCASKQLSGRKYSKVKNYPKETPFVYFNKIEIDNNKLTKDERSILTTRLNTQLVDSMRLRIKQSFVILKRLESPAAFDTAYARQSAANMEIFLKTVGYYNGRVKDTTYFDTLFASDPGKKQIRAATLFKVTTGPVFRMDSIVLIPNDSNRNELIPLQELTYRDLSKSLLKKGEPFTEEKISAEMSRLVELYRNNGYYNMSREFLYADVDTVFLKLLDPELGLDPIKQVEVFQEAQRRRENPLVNVYIRMKPRVDTAAYRIYYNDTITVYPEYKGENIDSTVYKTDSSRSPIIKFNEGKFKSFFIRQHLFLKTDSIYRAYDVTRTADELNKLNTWNIIKIVPIRSKSDSSKIEYDIMLIPAPKKSFTIDLESVFNSVSQNGIITTQTAGNLVGFGLNLGFRNRNFDKQGIQVLHTLRGGIEFGVGQINKGIQSTEITYSNSFTIPKIPVSIFKPKWSREWTNKKSFITTTVSAINRLRYFSLTNVGATFGWQFQTKQNSIWSIRPLNIEFVRLYNESPAFLEQLAISPILRNSFNEGFVLGTFNLSFSKPQIILRIPQTGSTSDRPTYSASYRINFEESGAIFGRLKKMIPLFDKDLYEYIRIDGEYKYEIKSSRRWWVFRGMAGAGYLYDSDTSNMPFFKQFSGGGPNSMRGWPLRSIGPGTSRLEQRIGRNQFFSRTGDMILEANAEYRYNIFSIWPNTLILRGAIFVDAGNIWNFRNKSNMGNDTVVFQLKNLYKDMSVSLGTGFRLDFVGLFLIRFDFGLRVKNPSYPFVATNNGWRIPKTSLQNLYGRREQDRNWRYENFNISLGIGYPF